MNAPPMGIVYATVTVFSPDRTRSTEIRLPVDTGSVLSWLPRSLLAELGIVPLRSRTFRTIDGGEPIREVGEAPIRCQGVPGTVPVVFAEESDACVLGVTALEMLGLAVDPSTGHLEEEDVSLALATT